MTDWIEHNGGPQPVGDDVWVETTRSESAEIRVRRARWIDWRRTTHYRILNQHLIDAARLEGIRLGLEAAVAEVWNGSLGNRIDGWRAVESIRALNPDAIAKEAQHD